MKDNGSHTAAPQMRWGKGIAYCALCVLLCAASAVYGYLYEGMPLTVVYLSVGLALFAVIVGLSGAWWWLRRVQRAQEGAKN